MISANGWCQMSHNKQFCGQICQKWKHIGAIIFVLCARLALKGTLLISRGRSPTLVPIRTCLCELSHTCIIPTSLYWHHGSQPTSSTSLSSQVRFSNNESLSDATRLLWNFRFVLFCSPGRLYRGIVPVGMWSDTQHINFQQLLMLPWTLSSVLRHSIAEKDANWQWVQL